MCDSDAQALGDAAERPGKLLQIGHCVRFWPEYARVKEIVDGGQYGRVLAAIQTRGELFHWHTHIHTLLTCEAFTAQSKFLEVSKLDVDRLREARREAVFGLYPAEEKIEPEAVENTRNWQHSGFSVDQSVLLLAGDCAGIERLVG